jgi:hypothetical protein
MYVDAKRYRKMNYDMAAKVPGDTVVRLPHGMLGVRHDHEDGYFIIVLVGNEATGELNWCVWDWADYP